MSWIEEFWLDEPDSKNAFTPALAQSLLKCVGKMSVKAEDPIRTFCFRARGSVFMSGGHLRDHLGNLGPARERQRTIRKAIDQFEKAAVYKIAIVEGDVLGGGLEFLSAFDWVVAAPHVVFEWRQASMGLSYGWGGGLRLGQRVFGCKSSKLCARSELLSAEQAQSIGLVDRLIWPEPVSEHKRQMGSSAHRDWILSHVPNANGRFLSAQSYLALKQFKSANAEEKWFDRLWGSRRHRAQLAKFKERGT